MIYITGDTHGDRARFVENNMNDDSWNENDYLIVCGDFGYIFEASEAEEKYLDFLETKPYNICFCDGNHENFSELFNEKKYKKEKWNGGYVHRIRKNIFHLMRGQIFEIEGKKVFTFGGAYSMDRYMRKLGSSYWNEELPSDTEYKETVKNLKEHDNKVDIIITHTAPRESIRRMGYYPDMHDMELTGFLEWIMYEVNFQNWYFGHWHTDAVFNNKRGMFTAVLFNVHKVE